MPNLGIYVQVPFCAAKCTFCNFSSRVERSSIFDAYARALQKEVQGWPRDLGGIGVAPDFFAQTVNSAYFGGGTPTLLGADVSAPSSAPCVNISTGAKMSNSPWRRHRVPPMHRC